MKFVQFQAVPVPNTSGTQTDVMVYALGEDGRIYCTQMINQNPWWPLSYFHTNEAPDAKA